MKGFFRVLNLLVAAIAFFLLYQHWQKPLSPPPPPPPVEQVVDYPAAVPDQVVDLIESFEPLDGSYDAKRIAKVVERLDEARLREVVAGIIWDNEAGRELGDFLVEMKYLTPEELRLLDTGKLKNLDGIRKCLTDSRCFPQVEKCLLTFRCCILRCQCWPICKTCDICKPCSRYPCCWASCSRTMQVGLVGGAYKTVKKIRFDGNFSVALDGSDTAVITLNIPDNSLDGAKLAAGTIAAGKLVDNFAPAGALLDHLNVMANPNPHQVDKVQVGLGNVVDVEQIPLAEKGVANGVATLDGNGRFDGSNISDNSVAGPKLTESYALAGDLVNHLNSIVNPNPHQVSKDQVGLGNVDNLQQLPMSEKGVNGGVARLDVNGNLIIGNNKARITPTSDSVVEYEYLNCPGGVPSHQRHRLQVVTNMADPAGTCN